MSTYYSHSLAFSITAATATSSAEAIVAAGGRIRPMQVGAIFAVNLLVSFAFRADPPTVLDSFGPIPDLTFLSDPSPSFAYRLALKLPALFC